MAASADLAALVAVAAALEERVARADQVVAMVALAATAVQGAMEVGMAAMGPMVAMTATLHDRALGRHSRTSNCVVQ